MDFSPSITHESFVQAVSEEFTNVYGGSGDDEGVRIKKIGEVECEENEVVRKGREELQVSNKVRFHVSNVHPDFVERDQS